MSKTKHEPKKPVSFSLSNSAKKAAQKKAKREGFKNVSVYVEHLIKKDNGED